MRRNQTFFAPVNQLTSGKADPWHVDRVADGANATQQGSSLMKRLNILLAAAVAFTGAASAQMQGQGQGYGQGYGQQQQQPGMGLTQPQGGYNNQRGFTPPGAANLSSLSGNWNYTIPNGRGVETFQAQIDGSGRFMARSQTTAIQGQFNGMSGQGMAVSPDRNGRPMQNRVQLQFDGQCHIQLVMIGQNGRPFAQGTVHVNHGPGAPCPN
jgi:hypothetical protein